MTTRIRKRGPVDRRPKPVITKTVAQRKASERDRMRAAGFVLKQIWIKPEDWERVKKYLARL